MLGLPMIRCAYRNAAIDALAIVMFRLVERLQLWGMFCVLRQACKRLHEDSYYSINHLIATPASVPSSLPRLVQCSAWLAVLDLRQLRPITQPEKSVLDAVLLPDTLVDLKLGLYKPAWSNICRLTNLTFLGMAVWDDGGLDFPKLKAAEVSKWLVNALGLSRSPTVKSLSVAHPADLATILKSERLTALQAIQVREKVPSSTLLSWCQILGARRLTALRVHLVDEGSSWTGQLLPKLRQLSDLSLAVYDAAAAHAIVPHLTTLTRLHLTLTDVRGNVYFSVRPLKALRVLKTNASFTTFQLAFLQCTQLRVLHAVFCNSATFCQLPFLARFPFLEDLALEFMTHLSLASPYSDLQGLEKLRRLRSLRLQMTAPEVRPPPIMTTNLLSTITCCTTLSSLSLLSMGVTNHSVRALSRLGKLRELHLDGNPFITQSGMSHLSGLTNLIRMTPEGWGSGPKALRSF